MTDDPKDPPPPVSISFGQWIDISYLFNPTVRVASWHWLSFSDESPPAGRGFLGVAIVNAPSFLDAVTRANMLGINPGGEVRGIELPDGIDADALERFGHRLLTKAELADFDKAIGGRGEIMRMP